MLSKWLPCLIIGIILVTSSFGQDLTNIGFKKGLKINGGLTFNNIFYKTNDTISRRDPIQSILTGNLNLTLFGYSAPFSFSYSNSQKNYTQPFNRFVFSPSYKWIKTYLGSTSMTFSPYTLSGHNFNGAGIELTPGKWIIAAMAGRLKKAVEYNPLTNNDNETCFKRIGYAFKLGYEYEIGGISLNVFSAKDQPNSIKPMIGVDGPQAMRNLAYGIAFHTKLLKNFSFDGEYSMSILNTNIMGNSIQSDSIQNTSLSENSPNTKIYDAYTLGIGYQISILGLTIRYERIAPDYQTLGAYYFNNDMENITLAPALHLLKGKFNIAGNAGLQRNNLDKSKESETKRWVGSLNMNYVVGEKWNVGVNYSNFSTYTRRRPQSDPFFTNELDSLNFYQINSNMGLNLSYTFGTKESAQSLMFTANMQQAKETTQDTTRNILSSFFNSNLVYSGILGSSGISTAISINFNYSSASGTKIYYLGPALNLSKALFKKSLRVGIVSAWNQSNTNEIKGSWIASNGLNINYSPQNARKDKHTISLNANSLMRFKSAKQNFRQELTVNLNYAYTF